MKNKKIKLLLLIVLTIIFIEFGTMFYFNKVNNDKDEEIKNNISEIQSRSKEMDVTALYTLIDYNNFKELYNQSKEFILVIGQSSCIHSLNYKKVINDVIKISNQTIYYLELDNLTTDNIDDLKLVINSLNTPRTIIINNKVIIDEIAGYIDVEELLNHITD